MDLTAAARTTADSDAGTPPMPTPNKPMGFLAYTNGAPTKRHYPTAQSPAPAPVSYKECMRNHAATLGGHALDGCCEFMPPSPSTFHPADPTSLRCGACGCHRNFHRRDPDDPAPLQLHRQIKKRMTSPPLFQPLPALMAFRKSHPPAADGGGKKRRRTRFTEEQKVKMFEFAERLGWKMQKVEKGMVEGFCNEVGVGREVLKVWMHNNKNTFGRKEMVKEKEIHNANNANYEGGHIHHVHLLSSSNSDN